MKSIILASAFAAALAMGLPVAAEAKTNVQIYLGVPHYGYQVGPDYRFRKGHGWSRASGYSNRGQLASGMSPRLNAMAAPTRLRPPAVAAMSPCL
jgi:hypothetical protein